MAALRRFSRVAAAAGEVSPSLRQAWAKYYQRRMITTDSAAEKVGESGLGYVTRLKNTVKEVIKFSIESPLRLEAALSKFNAKPEAERVAYTSMLFSSICVVLVGNFYIRSYFDTDTTQIDAMEARISNSISLKVNEELVKCSQSRADIAEQVLNMSRNPIVEDKKLMKAITHLLKENQNLKKENTLMKSNNQIIDSFFQRLGLEVPKKDDSGSAVNED